MACTACKSGSANAGNKYQCNCNYNVINEKEDPAPTQCKSCTCSSPQGCCIHSIEDNMALQKKIWRQVRVAPSLYMNNLTAITVEGPHTDPSNNPSSNAPRKQYAYVNWNQSSDRAVPSIQRAYRPSRGNSTRASLTRHRPGAGGPSGKGVDIKHNSYARYLARKNGKVFNCEVSIADIPKYGNKTQTYNIVNNT